LKSAFSSVQVHTPEESSAEYSELIGQVHILSTKSAC